MVVKKETRIVENTVASKILQQAPLQSPVARPVLALSEKISTGPATRPQQRTSTKIAEGDRAVCVCGKSGANVGGTRGLTALRAMPT